MNDSSPEQLNPVTSSTKVTSTLEQLSVAVGAAGISSPHCNSTAIATSLKTGASSSKTEMVCEAVELFPQPSVKVYSRTTSKHPAMPSAVLEVSVQETVTAALQLSLNSTAPYSMDSSYSAQATVTSSTLPIGASSSANVITWVAKAELPHASVAVNVRMISFSPVHVMSPSASS